MVWYALSAIQECIFSTLKTFSNVQYGEVEGQLILAVSIIIHYFESY